MQQAKTADKSLCTKPAQEQPVLLCGMPLCKPHPEYKAPVVIGILSKEEFDAELQKGYDDFLAGRSKPADEVFGELDREFGLLEIPKDVP